MSVAGLRIAFRQGLTSFLTHLFSALLVAINVRFNLMHWIVASSQNVDRGSGDAISKDSQAVNCDEDQPSSESCSSSSCSISRTLSLLGEEVAGDVWPEQRAAIVSEETSELDSAINACKPVAATPGDVSPKSHLGFSSPFKAPAVQLAQQPSALLVIGEGSVNESINAEMLPAATILRNNSSAASSDVSDAVPSGFQEVKKKGQKANPKKNACANSVPVSYAAGSAAAVAIASPKSRQQTSSLTNPSTSIQPSCSSSSNARPAAASGQVKQQQLTCSAVNISGSNNLSALPSVAPSPAPVSSSPSPAAVSSAASAQLTVMQPSPASSPQQGSRRAARGSPRSLPGSHAATVSHRPHQRQHACNKMAPSLPQYKPPSQNSDSADQTARQLTGRLSACVDMSLLVQLVQQFGSPSTGGAAGCIFNHIHAATSLLKAAHLLKEGRASVRQFYAVCSVARSYVAQMDARGLSTSLWAVAASGCTDDAEFMAALLQHMRRSIASFNGQSLASTAWSLSCLPRSFHDVELLGSLVAQARAKLHGFDSRSLAGLLFALAKVKQGWGATPAGLPALTAAILEASRASLWDFNAQGLANTAWAIAVLEHRDAGFTDLLLAACRNSLQGWCAHQIATLFYALAKQKQDRAPPPACLEELLPEILAVAAKRLADFGAHDMSNAAWALATLEHSDTAFLQALLTHAVPKLRDFTAQGLSNTCWSMAVLQHSDSTFLEACLAQSKQLLHTFAPQNLAKMAWALAKLGYHDQGFMNLLLTSSKQTCHEFNSQDLSNLLFALAKLHHPDKQLVEAVLVRARQLLPSFLPQHLANVACALAKLGHYDADFMRQLLAASRHKLPQFQHQDLSNVAWALAQLQHHDSAFMEALLVAATPKLQGFINQELANIMWAMASLHHQDAAVVEKLMQEVSCRLHSLNDQDVANVMWALAVLDHNAAVHVQPLLLKALQHYRNMSGEHMCQVFQYLLTMEEAGHISRTVQAGMQYQQLRSSCLQAWNVSRVSRPSHTQLNVLHAIRALPGCADAGSESLTEDGLFSMDIALHLPGGERVAIEVDGPHHFMSNAGSVASGATALRNRMLRARGWKVISVPTCWWNVASKAAPGAEQRCLQQLLHHCHVQLPQRAV